VGEFDPGNGKEPFTVVGFKMQFTLTEGDNSNCYFLKNKVGFGINKESKLEGFRRKNAIATWLIGPLLPLNPYLTRWILDMAGEEDTPLAFEEEAVAAYQKHAREMVYPGMHLHY
ncbi:MAG: glutamine amidotransferase, partial [Atopobium sp.]|nr:glutamine amidotransferase [Atopobium sp.]